MSGKSSSTSRISAVIVSGVSLRPVYTGDFCANFVAAIRCNFCLAQVASSSRMCKRAAISVRFGRDLSPRYRSGFERVRNLMQICGDFS